MEHCFGYLKSKGAINVRVDVLMHNTKALNLYVKLGFNNWVEILKKEL